MLRAGILCGVFSVLLAALLIISLFVLVLAAQWLGRRFGIREA